MWLCLRFCVPQKSGRLDPVQVRDSRIPGPPVRIFGAWWSSLWSSIQRSSIWFYHFCHCTRRPRIFSHPPSIWSKKRSEHVWTVPFSFPWLSSARLIVDFWRFSAVRCDELVQKEISSEETIAIFWTTYMYVCIYYICILINICMNYMKS